jgi:hypothetical protein
LAGPHQILHHYTVVKVLSNIVVVVIIIIYNSKIIYPKNLCFEFVGLNHVFFSFDYATNMVRAVNIHAILNTFVLISINKQTLYIAGHPLCFRVTFWVKY